MPYNFNPHCHVKIWLSKDKNTFLNLENRVRLIEMRTINPDDEIYFIYDSSLLSPKALEELKSFCAKYTFTTKDVQEDVIPYCDSETERGLIEIYADEISHLEEGGNLAVASDILRWLKPVYELGTYADFDVFIDTRKLPETITVEKPFLLRIGSRATPIKGDFEAISLNTDTIAVVSSQEALSDIQKIQKIIYDRCSRQPSGGETSIERFLSSSKERLSELFSPDFADRCFKQNIEFITLSGLVDLSRGKTAREVRKEVIDATANNLCFGKIILSANKKSHDGLDEHQIIKEAAGLQRAILKQQLGWITWIFAPKAQYKRMEIFASIQDDNELLTRIREEIRYTNLINSVIYTSGPGVLYGLFDKIFYKKDTIDTEIAPFSFGCYGLDKTFISGNNFPLHANLKTVGVMMQNTEVGKVSDLSWLQEGQNATAIRERKIIEAQLRMPQDFHDMREKIEAHIKKIQADLGGWFSCYRQKERYAKIHALQSIIGHFENHSFDVGAFNAALHNYRTKDIFASIGNSRTKELIDELEGFSQRAKYYMRTDEREKVEILPPTRSLS